MQNVHILMYATQIMYCDRSSCECSLKEQKSQEVQYSAGTSNAATSSFTLLTQLQTEQGQI